MVLSIYAGAVYIWTKREDAFAAVPFVATAEAAGSYLIGQHQAIADQK
jgi:hypothetical protein